MTDIFRLSLVGIFLFASSCCLLLAAYYLLPTCCVQGAGRLPVVSGDGKLLGLVTRTDVLRERKLYASVGGTGQRRVR